MAINSLRKRESKEHKSSVAAILHTTSPAHLSAASPDLRPHNLPLHPAEDPIESNEKQPLMADKNRIAMQAQLRFQQEQLIANLHLVVNLNQKLNNALRKSDLPFEQMKYFILVEEITHISEKIMPALDQIELVIKQKDYKPSQEVKPLLNELDAVYKDLKNYRANIKIFFDKVISAYAANISACKLILDDPLSMMFTDAEKAGMSSLSLNLAKNFLHAAMKGDIELNIELLGLIFLAQKIVYNISGFTDTPRFSTVAEVLARIEACRVDTMPLQEFLKSDSPDSKQHQSRNTVRAHALFGLGAATFAATFVEDTQVKSADQAVPATVIREHKRR